MADLTDAEWLKELARVTLNNQPSEAQRRNAERALSIAAKLERQAGSLIRKARLEYNPERFTGTVTVAIEGMPFSMATGCEPVDGLPVKVTITPAGEDGG